MVRCGGAALVAWGLTVAGMAWTARPEPASVALQEPAVEFLAGKVGGPLPRFVDAAARPAYEYAVAAPDLLRAVPCYCGCVNLAVPHRDLYDCFVTPDGFYDSHAAGCGVCQLEALDVQRQAGAGLTLAEIRQQIDTHFGESGPGTHTA